MNEALKKKLLGIASKHGTPLFVLDEKVLKQNLAEFGKTARKFFPRLEVCYSVKTNSLPEVIAALNCGFEVASLKELQLVKFKKNCFKVFNSPCKKESEIEIALRQKAIVIADSFSELERLSKISKKLKLKSAEIGLRLNFLSRKFGFSFQQLQFALKKCNALGLNPVMLHSHSGTKQSLQAYSEFLQYCCKAVDLHDWKFLNLGAGFPSFLELELQGQKLSDYFELAKKILGEKLKDRIVVFEPGRILVSDAMFLLAKVCVVKELNGRKIAVLDAGINFLPKLALSYFKFTPLQTRKNLSSRERTLLVGPLLFNNDILASIPYNLKEGELVLVENAGAYCLNLAWSLSFEKPKVVKI